MKNKSIAIIIILAIFAMASCNQNDATNQTSEEAVFVNSNDKKVETIPTVFDSTAYTFLQNNCMTCHSSIGKTHDQMIAPPIIAVKRRYKMEYEEREDFIKNVVEWANDPKEENGIMRGAIDKFKTMPYMNYKEEDLEKVAAFIFDNDMEKPEWFEEHFKEMHPDGKMGQGRGFGKGQRKGLRKNK